MLNVQDNRKLYEEAAHPLKLKHMPMCDYGTTRINRRFLQEAFQFIAEGTQGTNCTLLHCMAGVNRSATIAILYVMHVRLACGCVESLVTAVAGQTMCAGGGLRHCSKPSAHRPPRVPTTDGSTGGHPDQHRHRAAASQGLSAG